MAKRSRTSKKAEHLRIFGRTVAVGGFWARRVDLFGIGIPVVGISIVFALALVALTIWGVVTSRAPAHITQHVDHRYQVSDDSEISLLSARKHPLIEAAQRAGGTQVKEETHQ